MADQERRSVVVGRRAAPPPPGVEGARRGRGERGMVVAEAAVVIPALLAVAAVLVWVVSLATAALSLGDATRQAARDVARGVAVGDALRAAADRAPGARLRVVDQGGSVLVTADLDVRAPVLRDLTVTVHQEVAVPKEWQ